MIETNVINKKIGYNSRHSSIVSAAQLAINGAKKEAMPLMNCPKERELAKCRSETTFDTSGFNETCNKTFPIPNKEKEISIMTNS